MESNSVSGVGGGRLSRWNNGASDVKRSFHECADGGIDVLEVNANSRGWVWACVRFPNGEVGFDCHPSTDIIRRL